MSVDTVTEWIEPYAGFVFQDTVVIAERAEQSRALACCDLDPAIFGDDADPAFFIAHAIAAGVANGISSDGSVNMMQGLVQHRPVPLDVQLTVLGRVLTVEEVPRGKVVGTEVWFEDADGTRYLTTARKSLRPDPAKVGARGAGERPPPVVDDPLALVEIGRFSFDPERVKAYNSKLNPIHFEPEAAARAGFRAPIIGGGMGVHFLTAEIWKRRRPQAIDLSIYFRRPVFWDDSGTVRVSSVQDHWTALCLEKDGKVATEARVNSIA